MLEMRAALEVARFRGFGLWPVAEVDELGFFVLDRGLGAPEVGMVVMQIADTNNVAPAPGDPPRPQEPVGAFLHGLLTSDDLVAYGGIPGRRHRERRRHPAGVLCVAGRARGLAASTRRGRAGRLRA
ncbi:hypothetical protein GCM10022221_44680 [Actinocorallia aurea]